MDINTLHKQAADGDPAARDKLFELLSVRFRLLAHQKIWNQEEANDVVQDALAAISREFEILKVESSFAAWAYKVLDNRILASMKSKRTEHNRLSSSIEVGEIGGVIRTDPELMIKLEDCLRKVLRANQRYARVLNLSYQGYTIIEICSRLKVKKDHAYVLLSRARSMLALCLEKGEI